MNCKECVNRPKLGKTKDEQYYVDIIDSMAERTNRRAHILNIVLSCIVALLILVCVFLAKQVIDTEREFETVEQLEYDYDIEQDATDGGRNYIVGGDYYGETEGHD